MSLKHEQKDGNMNHLYRPVAGGPPHMTHHGNHPHHNHHMQQHYQGYQNPSGSYQQQLPHSGGGGDYNNAGMGGQHGNMGQQHYGNSTQSGGMRGPHMTQQPNYPHMNYRGQYREARPTSPTKSSQPARGILDEIDDQAAGYKDDRIQNELLKEICSDIGIDDAMDLDIFDFDAPADNYYFPQQSRLSDFGIDQNTPFSEMPGGEEMSKPVDSTHLMSKKEKTLDSSMTKLPLKPEAGEMSPYTTQSVPSVKSVDYSQDAAVDSPTVSSSVPGNSSQDYIPPTSSTNSQPDSYNSSLGSPLVHSTTPSLCGPYEYAKPPSSMESLKPPSSVDSVSSQNSASSLAPPVLQRAAHGRQDSVDSTASCPPNLHKTGSVGSPMSPAVSNTNLTGSQSNVSNRSVDNVMNSAASPGRFSSYDEDDINDRTLVDLTDDQQYTSRFKSDVFTCYSQPASPAKTRVQPHMSPSTPVYKAQSMNDNLHRHAIHRLQSHNGQAAAAPTVMKTEKDYEAHTDDQKAQQNMSKAAAQSQVEFKVPQDLGKISSSTIKTEKSSSHDQGYSSMGSQSISSGSHYGSSSNLSHASVPSTATNVKDSVKRFNNKNQAAHIPDQSDSGLEVFSMPSTADLNIPNLHSDTPSNCSSQSNSPTSIHVAKRAKVINSGSDLLEEMRERYSFTKGADLYAPPSQYPQIPVQRVRPTPHMQPSYQSSGVNPTRVTMQTQVPSQFNFCASGNQDSYPQQPHQFMGPNGNNMNMNNNSQGMMQRRTMYNNSMQAGPNMGYAPPQISGGNNMQTNMYSNTNNAVNNVRNASHYPSNPQQPAMDMSAPQQSGGHGGQGMNVQGGHMGSNHTTSNHRLHGSEGPEPSGSTGSQQQHMGAMQETMAPPNAAINACKPVGMGGMPGIGAHPPPVAASRMSANVGQVPPYGQGMNYGGGGGSGVPGGRGCNSPVSPSGRGGKVYHNMDNKSRQFEAGSGPNQYQQQSSQGNQTQYGASHHYNPGVANSNTNTGYPGNNMQGSSSSGPNYRSQSTPGYPNNHISSTNPNEGGMPMGMNAQMGPGMMNSNRGSSVVDPFDGPNTMASSNTNMPMRLPVQGNGGSFVDSDNKVPTVGSGGGMGGAMQGDSSAGMSLMSRLPRPTPGKLAPPPEGLMQQIISDRSSAFRSHPLFPLLRDLIIADMNFHTPSFPFQLIANLPADFDKLLQNYLNRNPPMRNVQPNPPIEQVVMDALKYAHQSLIEKIQVKKEEVGYQETPKPLSAIEDFCERFDRAVKNSLTPKPSGPLPQGCTSKALPPKTPTKAPHDVAPSTPKKDAGRNESKTDNEKAAGSTPTSKGTAGRNKVLPKEAVALMLDWLREHQDNPYPNDDEKEMLIAKTKLTINQINYWFTNARRRILPKWALQRYMEQQQHSPFGPPRLGPM